MQERRPFTALAEQFERDVLPVLNLIVLLLPIVLLIIDFAAHSTIAITLPDPKPNVAALDTPPVRRRDAVGVEDPNQPSPTAAIAPRTGEPPATGPSPFCGSLLGYGE